MNALNQIILEGNVVRQPEKKLLPSGYAVCTMPIAVNRKYKTQEGQAMDDVSFFDVESYGNLAEACVKWCPKGRGVRIVGRLKQNRWKDESGKYHDKIKIIAEHIDFKFYKKNTSTEEPKSAQKKLTKEQKLAMLAEAASAAASQAEQEEVVF